MESVVSYQNQSMDYAQMVDVLCDTAKTGLVKYYENPSKMLPYTAGLDDSEQWVLSGSSLRYAAISHIGISKWLLYNSQDRELLPSLWPAILEKSSISEDIGDVALSLWSGCQGTADPDIEKVAERLVTLWDEKKGKCNSVELGWVLKSCLMIKKTLPKIKNDLESILNETYNLLRNNYNANSSLFCRHKRTGFKQKVSGQIACFADQVYPIVALSQYAEVFGNDEAKKMVLSAVDKICEYQGDKGQWMWHYDIAHNRLCEEYPVFSVHQDSMAPMAILAGDSVTGQDHTQAIKLGVEWLFGNNELNTNLVLKKHGLIWRDIERKEPEKWTRNVKGLCNTYGMSPLGKLLTENFFRSFKINYECRPYHLGWILYAWADYKK